MGCLAVSSALAAGSAARLDAARKADAMLRLIPCEGIGDLGAWLARDTRRDFAFTQWVHSIPPATPPAEFSDGWTQVRLGIPAADLLFVVNALTAIGPADSVPIRLDFTRDPIHDTVLSVDGFAREGVSEVVVDGDGDPVVDTSEPLRSAAATALARDLLDGLARLKYSPTQRLADWFNADPGRSRRLVEQLRDVLQPAVDSAEDGVSARAEISLEIAVGVLDLTFPRGPAVPDFISILDHNPATPLTAHTIVLPPQARTGPPKARSRVPGWPTAPLRVRGRAVPAAPPGAGSAANWLAGSTEKTRDEWLELAQFDAMDEFRRRVDTLPLPGGGLLRDLRQRNPAIAQDIEQAILLSYCVGNLDSCDLGGIAADFELGLERLEACVARLSAGN